MMINMYNPKNIVQKINSRNKCLKSQSHAICWTHMKHFLEQGTNAVCCIAGLITEEK